MQIRDVLPHRLSFTKQPEVDQVTYYLDLITRVALGAIAALTSPPLFIPSFLVGVGVGFYHHYQNGQSNHHHRIGCGQGFMEWMAEMHFPSHLSLIANLGVTICHIDHHPVVFVPYCGLALGMWAGKMVERPLSNCVRLRSPI